MHCQHGAVGLESGVAVARAPDQPVHQRSHPAHRHAPLPGPLADDVVEEAAILDQRRIVRVTEHADLAVGEEQPAQHVVFDEPLDDLAQRSLDEAIPRLTFRRSREATGPVPPGTQRLEQAGPCVCRERSLEPEQVLVGVPRLVSPGQRPHGGPGTLVVHIGDQEAARLAVTLIGGKGRHGSPPRLEVDAQFLEDLLRQQAHEVGVARQVRIVVGEDPLRGRGASQPVVALEYQDRLSGVGEIGRRHEAVVAAAGNDRVISGGECHGPNIGPAGTAGATPGVPNSTGYDTSPCRA